MSRPVPAYKRSARKLQDAVTLIADADDLQLKALRIDIQHRLFHKRMQLEVLDTMILERNTRPDAPAGEVTP